MTTGCTTGRKTSNSTWSKWTNRWPHSWWTTFDLGPTHFQPLLERNMPSCSKHAWMWIICEIFWLLMRMTEFITDVGCSTDSFESIECPSRTESVRKASNRAFALFRDRALLCSTHRSNTYINYESIFFLGWRSVVACTLVLPNNWSPANKQSLNANN